jgi:hypothetical protein
MNFMGLGEVSCGCMADYLDALLRR